MVLESQVKQLEAYRTMYQQTADVEKTPQEAIELARLRRLVERQKTQVDEANHTAEVCQAELALKEQLLSDFAKKCFEYSDQLDRTQREHGVLQQQNEQLRTDWEIAQLRLKGAEARHLDLLGYLGEVQRECSNWRLAYEKAKEAADLGE